MNTNQTIFFFYHAPLCSSIIKTVLTAKLQILYLHLSIYLSVCPMFFSWPFSIILLLEAHPSVCFSFLPIWIFLYTYVSIFFSISIFCLKPQKGCTQLRFKNWRFELNQNEMPLLEKLLLQMSRLTTFELWIIPYNRNYARSAENTWFLVKLLSSIRNHFFLKMLSIHPSVR